MTTDKARELAKQIETSVNALAAETDAARRSDIFRGWLNAMAQFHNYSWNNQLLISMQCPTATRVAGFHTWRKMNRFVRKGEKGITILAPCIYKSKKREESLETAIEEQTHTVGTLRGFRAATVFERLSRDLRPRFCVTEQRAVHLGAPATAAISSLNSTGRATIGVNFVVCAHSA